MTLTESQARQATDLMFARTTMPAKAVQRAKTRLMADWAAGRDFTLQAVYYGKANWKGRGVVA